MLKTKICCLVLGFFCQFQLQAEVATEASTQQSWQVSAQLTVKQLAPGLWLHTSFRQLSPDLRFSSNGLLLKQKNEIWLIDTAWGESATAELLAWIKTELKLPVTKAIATHYHDDRTGGAMTLLQQQIPLFSSQQTRLLSISQNIPLPQSFGALQPGDSKDLGSEVEIFYPGPGHSHDNLVVYLKEHQLLFGGCAVKAPQFAGLGNIADADLTHWPLALQRVQQRYTEAKIVVPGHGEPGDLTLLSYSLSLFSADAKED
ncbi:Zn-dependent hydrolase, glyoxylase [Rheinheimera sp. A13L]|nr:Zn-dependent hydrolase, glyoxylase [Rheinheimera sp. A13L]